MPEQVDPALKIRLDAIAERKAAMAARMPKIGMVKVNPADDDVRRVLRHPTAGAFPKEGPAEWPLDKFTNRRLADGGVTLAEGGARSQRPAPQHRAPSHT
jgi:hypothetical protein